MDIPMNIITQTCHRHSEFSPVRPGWETLPSPMGEAWLLGMACGINVIIHALSVPIVIIGNNIPFLINNMNV